MRILRKVPILKKRMLSHEMRIFFDSHSKKSRHCYDLEHNISIDYFDGILKNNIIVKSVAMKKQNINKKIEEFRK